MTATFLSRAAAIAVAAAALSPALAEGPIGTVPRGSYGCELPGDAAGRAGIPQPDADFRIENASRYSSAHGGGSYLRRGISVVMTSGPRQGEAFRLVSAGVLRQLDDGKLTRLRCVIKR